jgi:nitrate/nitrite transporter NarK
MTVACAWAAIWLPVGALLGWPLQWFGGAARTATVLGTWTALGAVSGFVFAQLLARLERGWSIDRLRRGRVTVWGTLAGAGVPLAISLAVVLAEPDSSLTVASASMFALMGAIGAGSAFTTIRVALRGRTVTPFVAPPA